MMPVRGLASISAASRTIVSPDITLSASNTIMWSKRGPCVSTHSMMLPALRPMFLVRRRQCSRSPMPSCSRSTSMPAASSAAISSFVVSLSTNSSKASDRPVASSERQVVAMRAKTSAGSSL